MDNKVQTQLDNTVLGITSFIFSLLSIIFMILCVLLPIGDSKTFFGFLFIMFSILALVMAIIDVSKKNRKKTFSKIALIITGIFFGATFIISLIFVAFGYYYFGK